MTGLRTQPWIGLLLMLACAAAWAADIGGKAAFDPALDAQLARLQRIAYDKPALALQILQKLRLDPAHAANSQQLLLAEGRMQAAAGNDAAVEAIATNLSQYPQSQAQVSLLRALHADQGGRSLQAAEYAEQALAGLAPQCGLEPLGQPMAEDCDFRSAWAALRVLTRKRQNEGVFSLAEASARQGLALAEAGKDHYLQALSMGGLAVLSLLSGQTDDMHRWLAQGQKISEGDVLAMAYMKAFEAALASRTGRPAEQLRALEEGLALATQADAPHLMAQMQVGLADIYVRLQQPKKAIAAAEIALPQLHALADQRLERAARHNLALALIQARQFERARRELTLLAEMRQDWSDHAVLIEELREEGEAWAAAGQAKEALANFHAERSLNAELVALNREASLRQLKIKYDSERKQADLDLLIRDKSLVDKQLANRHLAQQVGLAVAALLALSIGLAVVMVKRVREANRRLKANQALLRAQSERDPLTDLANRRHFLGVMEQQAPAQFNGALLMIDIDHFKHVNDQHGHGVGDVVICEVARRLSHAVRAEDLVVRWGGEEFLVFAPDVSLGDLAHLAERILRGVGGQTIPTDTGPLRVTVSIGFAHFPLPPSKLELQWEQAVNWADMALYTAKSRGRNRAMGIATVDARDSDALTQIEADFDAACSSERVSLLQVLGPSA
ncbi:GGDEF domain-containing protein [Paucibacter sp. B2R-40]|uniref:GGDEF domain-containing protein n=1 Tax=Paucibacter sp. B2R-40 TaxID=2893554 RepID=UPI0021E4CE2B|nr:GGDEF domain-containing protein [Paucibacter sp. B2R-40]MCV2353747.1 GGDEF domain-containing protein [Paucibacter sp. B2R-40]